MAERMARVYSDYDAIQQILGDEVIFVRYEDLADTNSKVFTLRKIAEFLTDDPVSEERLMTAFPNKSLQGAWGETRSFSLPTLSYTCMMFHDCVVAGGHVIERVPFCIFFRIKKYKKNGNRAVLINSK